MNSFFRSLPLPAKLGLIGIIPLSFIIYLSIVVYIEKSENPEILKIYVDKIDEVGRVSDLINHLEHEQKLSFDYFFKKGDNVQLIRQRKTTDSGINLVRTFNDAVLKDFEKYTKLDNIQIIRNQIDSSKISANGITQFFSSCTFRLNTLTGVTFENKELDKRLSSDVQSQKLLTEMQTYLGIIRTNIYNILITRTYVIETLMGTYGAYDVYKSYETEFKIKSLPAVLNEYNKIRTATEFKPTIEYIDKLFKTFKLDSTYTPDEWWSVSEKGLSQLGSLEDKIWKKVNDNMNDIYVSEINKRNTAVVLLILAISLVVSFLSYTIAIISKMLAQLRRSAEEIATGHTGVKLDMITSKDAIGSLADSIKKVDENNLQLITAAVEIGKGNFNVAITPRSNNDTLANAIINMQQNLQKNIHEIEEREQRFRQLADLMPQMVWIADTNGKGIYLNEQWKNYLGEISWSDAIHPDDKEAAFNLWKKALHEGSEFTAEYRTQHHKTKEYRWFLARAIPIKDTDGKVIRWFGTSTDIHEKKTMNEDLQKLVDKRTEELKRSNEDLLQFAHVTSHDLKEPLRKVQIFSDRLRNELGENISEKSRDYLDKIQNAAKRQTILIEGVLEYSTIDSPEQEFRKIDINNLVKDILNDLEIVIQQKQAVIHAESLPTIIGSPILLSQLFYNLINNSLKFSRKNIPPVINIISDKTEVSLSEAKEKEITEGNYVRIKVEDNGIGFNKDASKKVFEVFTRLHRTDEYEGTGLGLALCKKIMTRHNGYIFASGEENKGATFYLLFPM